MYLDNIIVLGDPMVDTWRLSSGTESRSGGALNVFENLRFFTRDVSSVFPEQAYLTVNHPNRKQRSSKTFYKPLSRDVSASTIVCSDYNKGFLTNSNATLRAGLIIVDSKYCSLKKSLLNNCKIKILKHTQTDFLNTEFASLFDYIVLTDNENKVRCFLNGKLLEVFSVPKINDIKTTVGAGDVFVAALAFYLHKLFDGQDLALLFTAIENAIYWSSESIRSEYTSNLNYI